MKNSQENIELPSFALQAVYQDGIGFIEKDIYLQDLISTNHLGLILYFYPKDNTPGCSTQAIDFTEKLSEFHQLGYQVIGVSRDGLRSHQNFIDKKGINFYLISDADESLCQHFGVIQEKMLYGKKYLGVVRSTFVFDQQGCMIGSFRNVKAKDHADQLLSFLNYLT